MSHRGPGIPLDLVRTKDGRAILSRADLEQYDHTPQRSGGRDRYFCPIHGGDHQRSLSVDPDTGKYKCHTCGDAGTLREHWPNADGKPIRPARGLSIEELGRRELAAQRRAEEERVARLAADLPAQATAFMGRLDAMSAALRDPDCPGAAYLRRRGLDPVQAATLGVGYAPPNTWPGDRGRRQGRVVFPLADPATGRVVSAVGRLCIDPAPEWTDAQHTAFKDVKQRKLTGCPAGVWPYGSIAAAREHRTPLVLVEGPADALALMQDGTLPYPVLALLGTANVLTRASLQGIAGVVLALDDDTSGAAATMKAKIELAMAGVAAAAPGRGWLGGAKDAGELAARCVVPDDENADDLDGARARIAAIAALTRTGERLGGPTSTATAVEDTGDDVSQVLGEGCEVIDDVFYVTGTASDPEPPIAHDAPAPSDDWEIIDDVFLLAPSPPAPLIETCIWCGTWTPLGICCDACKQSVPQPLHITGHTTTPGEMTYAG